MNCRRLLPGAGLLLLLLGLSSEPGIWAQAPANPEANPEVLTRGPVHEGFVAAVGTEPRASAVVAKQPPEAIPEEPPEQKPEGADVRWLGGYWAWDEDRADFIWISGAWRDFPPDREWVPGYWAQAAGGWQWVSGFWQVETQTEVRYLPEPPATVDNGPSTPAPGADSTYVAGVWVYGDAGYRWRPGFWVRQQPNWVWTPAHYCWTPSGYVFIDGCWDYPVARRGLLFAPIFVRGWQPNWVYRPRYLVYETALLTSLFVRPRFGGYYFGDYYEPRYAQRGFVAWVDYQPYRGGVDPLYSYYRWQHRDNNRWDTDLRAVYDGRRRGDIPRPAPTLVQQQQQIQNVQKTANVNNNNVNVVNNLTMVAALNQVDKNRVKLQEVSNTEIAEQRQAVKQRDNVVRERRKIEVAADAKVGAEGKAPAAPKVAKLDLPKAPAAAKKGGVKAPPPPETPRAQDKPEPKADPKGKEQRPEPKADPKGKVEQKPEPKADPKGKVEQKPEPKADPRGKVEQKPEPKVDPKGKQPEPAPKPEPKGKVEQNPEPKVDPKGKQPEPAPKPAPKVEQKPEPKPAPKVEPKPAPKEQQPEPKGKPEPKLPVPEKPAPPPAQPLPKAPVTPEPAPKTPTVTPQPKLPVPDPTPQPRPVPEPPAPKAAPPAPPPPAPKAPPAPPPAPKAAPPAPPPAPKAAPPAPAPKAAPPAPAPKGPPPSKDKDKDVLFEESVMQELR